MNVKGTGIIVLVGLVLAACGAKGSAGAGSSPSPSGVDCQHFPMGAGCPTPSFVPPVPFISAPKAEYTSTCDYVLGDFSSNTSHGFRFIAGADITNTGNVGITIRLTASFKQLGSRPLVVTKEGQIPYNGKRSIEITKPVSQNELDLIQAAQGGGDICTAKAKIVGTFGPVHQA
jgi:hypothetical protein